MHSLRAFGAVSIGVSTLAAALLPLLFAPQAASGDPLASAQAEASQLSAQIQAEGQHLAVLSQQYDAAQQRVQQLSAQENQVQGQIGVTRQRLVTAQQNLRRQALAVYMTGSDTSLDGLFVAGNTNTALTQEYRDVAANNVSAAIDTLHGVQVTLSSEQAELQSTEAQAQTAVSEVTAARQQAEATQQQEQQSLSQVKGQIATLVAQQQAAEARAQQAAFQARVAAAAQAARQSTDAGAAGPSHQGSGSSSGTGRQGGSAGATNVPVAPGGEGAVQAAESQLGVPYVWGGESPGHGFDCSGLTQWSWGRAGVGIPRTAQAQYDAIVHVSMADLEPGDLLFWGYGAGDIYHVAMYVGNGEIIQAPETGENVSYAGISNNQLVGAGRP